MNCEQCNGTFKDRNGVISRYNKVLNNRYSEVCFRCMYPSAKR